MEFRIQWWAEQKDDFYDNQIEKLPDYRTKRLLRELKEEIENYRLIDFKIESWEIKVDNVIWDYADWIYKLNKYEIKPIPEEKDLYSLKMVFKLKKGSLEYSKEINLIFYYENWEEIAINYKWKSYWFNFWDKILDKYTKQRNKHGRTLTHEEVWKKVPIQIKDLKLILRFKTD